MNIADAMEIIDIKDKTDIADFLEILTIVETLDADSAQWADSDGLRCRGRLGYRLPKLFVTFNNPHPGC
jgi:hypothetical protein